MAKLDSYNGSTDTVKSPLEILRNQYLNQEVAINRYSVNNQYGINNPDAISDGDEFGKGQIDDYGTIGSKTDILTRTEALGFNKYNSKKDYKSSLNGA